MMKTMLVITPAIARALVFHLRRERVLHPTHPFYLIAHVSTQFDDGFGGKPMRMPIDVEYAEDARMLSEAFRLAARDPIHQPNFSAACRRRAIQLDLALGASAVDVLAGVA